MFVLTIDESMTLTVEPGSYVCIEDENNNKADFYEWEDYLRLDPNGDESTCKALGILENVYDTFVRKLGHPSQSSS